LPGTSACTSTDSAFDRSSFFQLPKRSASGLSPHVQMALACFSENPLGSTVAMHDGMRTTNHSRHPGIVHVPRMRNDDGLTLIEVCVGMVVLSVAALGSAGLSDVALNMVTAARTQTTTAVLAVQKMEQLRALAWRYVDSGALVPVTDTATDLSQDPMAGGGAGLSVSPGGTLLTNTSGYVDYLDKHGVWTGNGGSPPAAAVFIRRWNVARLPWSPSDSLVLRVLVTTVVGERRASPASPRRRLAGDAMVLTVLTRKAG